MKSIETRMILTPDQDEVRSALERVIGSSSFTRAERLSRFLRFVTERTLEGRGDELKEYLLGVEVFGCGFSRKQCTAGSRTWFT
jgi:hypothetical protein